MEIGINQAQILERIAFIKALPCWKFGCGGSVGSSFSLAFGKRISRLAPKVVERRVIEEYQEFGEMTLLVWCTWRLDAPFQPLTSSDDSDEGIQHGLSELIGTTVQSVEIAAPAWDLNVKFSNNLWLRVFCDHVPGDPSIEVNWELYGDEQSLHIGPGAKYRIEKQEPSVTPQ